MKRVPLSAESRALLEAGIADVRAGRVRQMNIFDLDTLGERLVDLDKNDELFNCTAQLVLAADAMHAYVAWQDNNPAEAIRLLKLLSQALAPFGRKRT